MFAILDLVLHRQRGRRSVEKDQRSPDQHQLLRLALQDGAFLQNGR